MKAPTFDDGQRWALLTTGAGLAAATVTRWALRRGWSVVTGDDPPDGRRGRDVGRVVMWSALAAGTVAAARVLAHRGARHIWTDTLGRDVPEGA